MATNPVNPRLTIFKSFLSKDDSKAFVTLFNKQKGNWSQIAKIVGKDPVLKEKATDLHFINAMADFSGEHLPLVKAFVDNPKTNSLRDIALNSGKAELAQLVAKTKVPETVTGDTVAIKNENYVRELRAKLFDEVPTAVIHRMVGTEEETPIADTVLRGGIITFLNNQPESFNIKSTSIYAAFDTKGAFKGISKELQSSVKSELKTLQRVVAISPVPEAVSVLMKANVRTAFQVSEMPEGQFVKTFKGQLGENGEDLALQVHTNAVNARLRNEHALMSLRETAQGTGIALIDKSLNSTRSSAMAMVMEEANGISATSTEKYEDVFEKHNLNWNLLFGDADVCECGECTSVYSAAAYFVELLQYLRNNNLDPEPENDGSIQIKSDPKDISGTPLEKLFDRRPDLGCLELTCPNTNTILPYVDLVNEVMENYVVFKHPKPFNVDDETSGELLAQPQHTEYQAYCILKDEVYPCTLPYHQPIDATRIDLEFLGTSRWEVIDTFRSPRKASKNLNPTDNCDTENLNPETINAPANSSKALDKLHTDYIDRAVDAEYLGLTQEEYVILIKEAFVSKEYWDKLCKKEHSQEEYLAKIDVKPVHKYYGYETEGDMLDDTSEEGLTYVKKQFLLRTGIQYTDLVELLLTQCLNPNMPRGKAIMITESLHFSYRYLQNYKTAQGEDKLIEVLTNSEKLIGLLPQLKDFVTFFNFENNRTLACPPASQEEFEISKADIKNWVKCHFEKIGKMIVLENGQPICKCPEGQFFWVTDGQSQETQHFFFKDSDEMMDDGKYYIDEECNLWAEGRIPQLDADVRRKIGSVVKSTGELLLTEGKFNDLQAGEVIQIKTNNGDVFNLLNGTFLNARTRELLGCLEPPQKDTCDLNTVRLVHLDGTSLTVEEYDHIHRFIRLWNKMEWTIDEVDKALMGLSRAKKINPDGEEVIGECDDCDDLFEENDGCADCKDDLDCGDGMNRRCGDCEIRPTFLHQLVAVKKLLERTGLELSKLLTFWTSISTFSTKSLYEYLFLTHNLLGMDKVFKADKNGNYLANGTTISEHKTVLMAAFNLSSDDMDAIIMYTGIEDKLTLANSSLIYRYRLLSKSMGLRIPNFIDILPLFGNPFKDADTTLEFMERWAKMEDAGFNYSQLNYVIRNYDDPKKPISPTEKSILQLAKNLYDGLNAIEEAQKDLSVNEDITDPEQQKLDIQAQASIETVRGKAALLFDPQVVEQITGILQGTSVFITNAPKNLNIALTDEKSLSKKLKYDKTAGILQITGILTEAETIDFKSLSNDTEWGKALVRIEKQQGKLFKTVLFDVFESEKALSVERAAVVKIQEDIIKAGDISIAFEEIPVGQEDTNTAPLKRAAFLMVFMPYLRRQLEHRFIVDTLAGDIGLESATTDALVSEVLMMGTPPLPIFNIFEKIKESAKPSITGWQGYFIPPAEENYTFIIKDSDAAPNLTIDGLALTFEAQEDPTNEWWSKPQKLLAGKLYKLSVSGMDLKNVFWKTATSAITAIPSANLLPDFASVQCAPAIILLKKAAILISGFVLSADEIRYFNAHKADFDELDFSGISLEQWLRLEAYTRLRNSLPTTKTNLLDFFNWATTVQEEAEKSQLSDRIVELTLWKKERVDKLIMAEHFNLNNVKEFHNEIPLLKLQKAMGVADKMGMDIDLLFDWAKPTSNFKKCRVIADSIDKAIRVQYKQTDWEAVVKPLNDRLRNNQKEALVAYLLQRPELITWGVTDADGLFEYFLIDVQMDACMETSRIKQAISSVQLFVMRCFLGLEEEHNGIKPGILDRERWDWMQRYRVWEANRKVFLYPENWIESNLRNDKSPFFKELESELLQKDINKQNVTDALKSYLYKVDEVANMEVIGVYIEGTKSGAAWGGGSKLHIFSRTRNAPYFFYYRYLALDEMNWYAWEKMQVDIPTYDIEDPITHEITGNGCYLVPVAWNGRVLIFFPQFMKKTKTNASSNVIPAKPDTNGNVTVAKVDEYMEIKIAWSEYRNGKWTQKQLSKETANENELNISKYKFIPAVHQEGVYINVDNNLDGDGGFSKSYIFDGSKLSQTTTRGVNGTLPIFTITSFHKSGTAMPSLQFNDTDQRVNSSLAFNDLDDKSTIINLPNYSGFNFFHPYTHDLLSKINLGDLNKFFNYNLSIPDKLDAFGVFDHDNNTATSEIYHELKRPYSLYNWELFFHTPMMLADALSKAQQYEEAMRWYHFVFSPMADGNDDKRFWQFAPFKDINSQRILDSIFIGLQPNTADKTINEWRNHPFMPHLVARSRPVAYMKWVVMKYLDNLIAWGDYLFRQDTIETINQATQLYILAGHILGRRPMMIPKRGKTKPQTYLGLLDKWDAFGNAMVALELSAPYSNQITAPIGTSNGVVGFANIFGFSTALYFCIPNNPKLMDYWDSIADRLFKIRHCENIQGVFRKLPLFEPPIDPALLVKAAVQGLSIDSILNDLNTPMPNYRFYYLLQKSLELCSELKSFGGAMLLALEKKDNESISLLRAKHESTMQNLLMEVKKQQLEEAQKSLETLEQNRKAPEHRMKYYLQLIGEDIGKVPGLDNEFSELANAIETPNGEGGLKLIKYEKEDMDKASEANEKQKDADFPEKLASILHIIPSFSADLKPIGIGAGISFGGSNLGQAAQAWAKFITSGVVDLSFQSSKAAKKGSFTRALQDRIMQANAAGYEIKQIDKQITAQQIRINIANLDIGNQQKQIDNANEVEEFLKNKYTGDELYTWMRGSLKTLYHQVYSLTYDLAKKCEKVYRFERGLSNSNFINAGYWDAGHEGLLAGEQLYVGLKQLEAAYQENRGYDYEITKHISLRQINPIAILQLREIGKCEFELPEILFDMDFPGHYKRRIKSVSLSVPCVAGPYTNINATLRLLENKFRNSSIAVGKADYPEKTEETDERFSSYIIPISAIAASSAQNDSGTFELNFKDERYLPFEGAGAISKWRLELPDFRQFDYNTISDAVIHLKYISDEGGGRLKKAATDSAMDFMKSVEELGQQEGLFSIIDLQHDLPTEWHKAIQVKEGDTTRTLTINNVQNFLPYFIKTKDGKPRDLKTVKVRDVLFINHSDLLMGDMTLDVDDDSNSFTMGIPIGDTKTFVISDAEIKVADWQLKINNTDKIIDKAFMVIRFTLN